jgi:hypothetical protein
LNVTPFFSSTSCRSARSSSPFLILHDAAAWFCVENPLVLRELTRRQGSSARNVPWACLVRHSVTKGAAAGQPLRSRQATPPSSPSRRVSVKSVGRGAILVNVDSKLVVAVMHNVNPGHSSAGGSKYIALHVDFHPGRIAFCHPARERGDLQISSRSSQCFRFTTNNGSTEEIKVGPRFLQAAGRRPGDLG